MDAGAHDNRSCDRSPIPGALTPIESPQKKQKDHVVYTHC